MDMFTDPRRIPIFGDDIYQVGQVIDIWGDGCAPDPYVFVMGFFEYIPQLVWGFIKPEPEDQTTDRFGRRHKRKRRRIFHVFDIDPLGPQSKPGVKQFMYNSIKLKERIGWYFLIIDGTSDFLINWTSLAYQWSGCKVPNPIEASKWGGPVRVAASLSTVTRIVPSLQHQNVGTAFSSTTTLGINTTGPKQVSGHATFRINPLFGFTGVVTDCFIRVTYPGGVVNQIPMNRNNPDELPASFSGMQRRFIPGLAHADYNMFVTFTGGVCDVLDNSMSASGAPDSGLDADP